MDTNQLLTLLLHGQDNIHKRIDVVDERLRAIESNFSKAKGIGAALVGAASLIGFFLSLLVR